MMDHNGKIKEYAHDGMVEIDIWNQFKVNVYLVFVIFYQIYKYK